MICYLAGRETLVGEGSLTSFSLFMRSLKAKPDLVNKFLSAHHTSDTSKDARVVPEVKAKITTLVEFAF